MRKRLAAVAKPERERIGAREKRRKQIRQARIEQHGLRPTAPRAQHIAERKAAAERENFGVGENARRVLARQIGRRQIDGGKTGAIESRRQFALSVRSLLAQNNRARFGESDCGRRCGRGGAGDFSRSKVKREQRRARSISRSNSSVAQSASSRRFAISKETRSQRRRKSASGSENKSSPFNCARAIPSPFAPPTAAAKIPLSRARAENAAASSRPTSTTAPGASQNNAAASAAKSPGAGGRVSAPSTSSARGTSESRIKSKPRFEAMAVSHTAAHQPPSLRS